MRKLLQCLAVLALAAPLPALAQADVLDKSWTSTHWRQAGMFGEAPKRAVILIDIESVRTGATPNLREFNIFSLVEGMPPKSGIIGRMRIDCTAMTSEELGSAEYWEGARENRPPRAAGPQRVLETSRMLPTVKAVCGGDWGAMPTVDVSIDQAQAKVFRP